jgi:Tfp pilus assembly protein PilN
LKALSSAIPPDVWLLDLSVTPLETSIKGGASDFTQISDFTSKLSQSGAFSEVQQQDSSNQKDAAGGNVILFGLSARRN